MLSKHLYEHIQKLAGDGETPVAVAFSGGGDSTALLSLVVSALKQHSQRHIHALIVDHGLRAGSDEEAQLAAARADEIGAIPTILTWRGEKPKTGLQERARLARYGLLGDACREQEITHLFLGHNQNDQAETILMREEKGSGWRGLAGMRVRTAAPVWPALYNVDVLRPLLAESRAALRDYNRQQNLDCIDDPSNENHAFHRIRARQELTENREKTIEMLTFAEVSQTRLSTEKESVEKLISETVDIESWGGAYVNLEASATQTDEWIAMLRYLIPSISGEAGFPPSSKLEHLAIEIQEPAFQGATLAGAQIVKNKDQVLIVRDPGMVLGRNQKRPLAPVKLTDSDAVIWDGRFLISSTIPELEIVATGHMSEHLTPLQKKALKAIPACARNTIPALCQGREIVKIPFVEKEQKGGNSIVVEPLISQRLRGLLQI